MKILHVSKKYPQALGGDAVVVANLQKHQEAANNSVVIVTSNCDEIQSSPTIYKIGLKDTPAGLDAITLKRIISLLILAVRMFRILRKEHPAIIHTHSVDMAFFVSFAARFYRIPLVHTFHIVTFYDANQSVIRRKSELWLAKRAKPRIITAPNSYDVKKLQSAGLIQTVLLPNGVDMDFWKTYHRAETSEFVFITIGRLEPQKGYHYLVKAVALLAQAQAATFRIIVVGEGSQLAKLQQLVHNLEVSDSISFVGLKQPEEIHALLSQSNAAIFPSLYETTPITLLEAWAAGLPVIMTSVGILRDVPTDFQAAYIVPIQDEYALMHAMQRCINDAALRQHVAAKGYEEAKKYAWPTITKTADAIYRGAQ